MAIGDSTVMEYCTCIKFIIDLLRNIGASVTERNLMIYTLNGLSPNFAHIVTTILHQKPFPTWLGMRAMLTLEEHAMIKNENRIVPTPHLDKSSSPTNLNTEHQPPPSNNSTRGSSPGGRGVGHNSRGCGGHASGQNSGGQGG